MYKLYFTKSLAEILCNDFSHLKNQLIPHQFETLYFSDIKVVQMSQYEYDVVLIGDAAPLPKEIRSEVQSFINMRLLDYLEAEKIDFNFCGYGMGYAKICPEKDTNGIDLYL